MSNEIIISWIIIGISMALIMYTCFFCCVVRISQDSFVLTEKREFIFFRKRKEFISLGNYMCIWPYRRVYKKSGKVISISSKSNHELFKIKKTMNKLEMKATVFVNYILEYPEQLSEALNVKETHCDDCEEEIKSILKNEIQKVLDEATLQDITGSLEELIDNNISGMVVKKIYVIDKKTTVKINPTNLDVQSRKILKSLTTK